MTTIKRIGKLSVVFLLHFFFNSNCYCQEKGLIRMDTIKRCLVVVTENPFDYSLINKIDSLIKCDNDTSVIKLFTYNTENSHIKTDYTILYKRNKIWQLEGNNKSTVGVASLPFGFHIYDMAKPNNVIINCPGLEVSVFEKYYYFYVANKKIIKSYDANIPISMAIKTDKRLINDLALFEQFDRYLTSQKNK